jgi:colicin import membrane protein
MWARLSYLGLPLLVTFGLHLLVVLALVWRMPVNHTVVAQVAKPVAIQASLVEASTLKKQAAPQNKPEPKPVAQPKPKPKPQPKPTAAPKPQSKAQPAVQPKPEPDKKATPLTPAPKRTEPSPEQIAAEARKEFERQLASQSGQAGDQQASKRDQIAAIIRQAVVNRWTRPPSARNGMVVILAIQMVPTGDVVGVSVLQSSGNLAFDRSAINAVERAGRFPEVADLAIKQFERDFRRFELIFRPEDLRY